MKKLILSELIILFLATTFIVDTPTPGWYQQTLPVNKLINDIFFIDTLNGWLITDGNNLNSDTAYILRSTNGGNNWTIQYQQPLKLKAIQFVDINTGYIAGGTGTGTARVYKTTNSGGNWNLIFSLLSGSEFQDVFFVNKDTGWVGDDNTSGGTGLQKTTNGGLNWVQQLSGSFGPSKIFFLNKDTGWAACQNTNLYRTTNGGSVWTLQYSFPFNNIIYGIFFINNISGWTINYSPSDTNGIYKTINGGFNWQSQIDPDPFGSGLNGIYILNSNSGYIATGFSKIIKTSNGGLNWWSQNAPQGGYIPIKFIDSLKGWSGGVWQNNNFVAHTIDGGGPPVGIATINNTIPKVYKLYQNHPNPFNPTTKIKASLTPSEGGKQEVKLLVYDITGKEINVLLYGELSAGIYEVDFNGNGLASGIYFYSLIVDGNLIDTKKMILLK